MLSRNIILNKFYCDGTEITPEEYARILEEIKRKASYVDKICAGTASIEDVPPAWRDEVQRRVTERQNIDEDPDLTSDEALDIIVGGVI